MKVLETHKLTKKYRRITALNQLDLQIEAGMVFGLLGPNGSGKTTTLGLILNVLKATSGSYSWFGEKPSAKNRRKIGAILETPCFYPYMTAVQNLRVVGSIKTSPPERIDAVLEQVGLFSRRNDPFKTYSLGMKQRLAIASALLPNPQVLILDEPTNGLDPMGIFEIRQLITEIAQSGKTIILASHLLDEVQKVCSHFMVLQTGEKLFQGSVTETLDRQRQIDIASEDLALLEQEMKSMRGIKAVEVRDGLVSVEPENEMTTGEINRYLFSKNIVAHHLIERGGSLEEQFLKILSNNDE